MKPRTLHRQSQIDQLLAVLRDAEGFPMSTNEICEAMGPFTEYRPAHNCPDCSHVEPHVYEHPDMAWYHVVYPALCRFEKKGRIQKLKIEGMRKVYWRLADTAQEDGSA